MIAREAMAARPATVRILTLDPLRKSSVPATMTDPDQIQPNAASTIEQAGPA
jgi:hypothetical protein